MSKYDKASLVHIPSGYKSSTLYNVLPNDADGDFDFTRASTATRVDENGLIETIAIGTPRLNYPLLDGVVQDNPTLLLEPQRTNLEVNSEDIAGYSQLTNVTATNNQSISPDGGVNASLVTTNAVNGKHELRNTNITFASGTNYTASVFVKANGYDYFAIKFAATNSVFDDDYAWFKVSNGTTGTIDADIDSTSIEYYGNGWYRITATQQANATASGKIFLAIGNADNTPIFLGDGSSGFYVWGFQVEAGSYPTSYIPSLTGSQTTRSADAANGAGTANDFNDSEGVLYANIAALADDLTFRQITINDGSLNTLLFGYRTNSNRIYTQLVSNNVSQSFLSFDVANITEFHKVATKYSTNSVHFWIDGFKRSSDTSAVMMTGINKMDLRGTTGSGIFYGKAKEVIAFNEALSDTELEDLTSYDSFNSMATEQLYTIE